MNDIFKIRLRYHMTTNRYRLKDLAEGVGVSVQCVQMWRGGQSMPSINRLGKIAKFLNVQLADLIT